MKASLEKTKKFYREYNDVCSCDACQNFSCIVKNTYPELDTYLQGIGVDITKPFETIWFVKRESKHVEHSVSQYIVFGSWENDTSFMNGLHQISKSESHPSTRVDDNHFVIDITNINLPWKLPKDFDEAFPEIQRKTLLSRLFKIK